MKELSGHVLPVLQAHPISHIGEAAECADGKNFLIGKGPYLFNSSIHRLIFKLPFSCLVGWITPKWASPWRVTTLWLV